MTLRETLREALARGIAQLRAAGIEGAARDVRALLAEAAGLDAARLTLEADTTLADPSRFDALLRRRAMGEPVAKILGHRQFWGRPFEVTRDTLDPRPETETLIAAALGLGPVDRFADLGTGTGIIAISLLCEWHEARALATDISPAALQVARRNGTRHGVAARLDLRTITDSRQWLGAQLGQFDMILSNPPYISEAEMAELSPEVAGFDPHVALTPGGDGLAPYRALAAGVGAHLRPGGHLLVEIGWRQGPDVAALFERAGLSEVVVLPDLDGRDRVVQARKPLESLKNPAI